MTTWTVIGVGAAVALLTAYGALAAWTLLRLREIQIVRERLQRLADGLALLTDTTESGLATVIREVEHITRRAAAPRASRAAVTRRVASAARRGLDPARIAANESMSESEVRLHLSLAE